MKIFLSFLIALLSVTCLFGQFGDTELQCSPDTLIVVDEKQFPRDTAPYRFVYCKTRSKFGYRGGLGFSNFYYGKKTSEWVGQHGRMSIDIALVLGKINVGYRAKFWTLKPQKELEFNGKLLSKEATFNFIKTDYYLGYAIDFKHKISLEPSIGYSRSIFPVLKEGGVQQEYSLPTSDGLVVGLTFNKYIKIKDYRYFSFFGTLGYSFVDYSKTHPNLDKNYWEWTVGISYKGFLEKIITRYIDFLPKKDTDAPEKNSRPSVPHSLTHCFNYSLSKTNRLVTIRILGDDTRTV